MSDKKPDAYACPKCGYLISTACMERLRVRLPNCPGCKWSGHLDWKPFNFGKVKK